MKIVIYMTLILAATGSLAQDVLDGWYFNPEQSGNGFNVNTQADITGIALFDFERSGDNQWAIAVDQTESDGDFIVFEAELNAPAAGSCFDCPFMPNQGNASGDVIRIRFDMLPDNRGNTLAEVTLRGVTETYERQLFRFSQPLDFLLSEWNLVEVDDTSGGDVLAFVDIASFDTIATSDGQPIVIGELLNNNNILIIAMLEPATGLIFMFAENVVGTLDQAWAFTPFKEFMVGLTEIGRDPLTELVSNPAASNELRGFRTGPTLRLTEANDLGPLDNLVVAQSADKTTQPDAALTGTIGRLQATLRAADLRVLQAAMKSKSLR